MTQVTRPAFFKAPLLCAGLLVWLLSSPAQAVAPSLRSIEDARDLVTKAMEGFVANQPRASYRLLSSYWPLPASQLSVRIVQSQRERSALRSRFGISLGWEELGTDLAGERVARVRCVERFERGLIVWHFVFFRTDQVWQISTVRSSDDLELAFGSAAFFSPPQSAPAAPAEPPAPSAPKVLAPLTPPSPAKR